MDNYTASYELPPLPDYTLRPLPDLISWLPDKYLTLVLPIVAYWVVSLFFHFIDTFDLLSRYRLHTPEELTKRNRASRWDVFRDVVIQQIIQTIFGVGLAYVEPEAMHGQEGYQIAVWAQRIRLAQRAIPGALALVGVNADLTATKLASSFPMFAGLVAGGKYPGLFQDIAVAGKLVSAPAFAPWEILLAKVIYWGAIQALQFFIGFMIVDTWQYFLHRAMHMNKTLYVTFHARHHRLYVPYAYGALYNHPVEGFVLDTLGTGLAYLLAGMTCRQSMWFFTVSTIKTVDDHCGYALPFDPIQLISSNNAAYHDIHHQSWGIKTNFSQPFFTFWDRCLGTMWSGDVKLRYERSRIAASKAVVKDAVAEASAPNTPTVGEQDRRESGDVSGSTPISKRRSSRKKRSSISEQLGSLKGQRDRMNQNLQGKGRSSLGVRE